MSCLDVIASDDSELVLSSEVVVISNERHQHYLLSKAVKMCHVMSCHDVIASDDSERYR